MWVSGLTRLSISPLRAARRSLQAVGLLKLVGKHRAGAVRQTFTLIRLRPGLGYALNVTSLTGHSQQKGAGQKTPYDLGGAASCSARSGRS
jgi:hypothetical protein